MKNEVIFRDNQELDADDFNNIQLFARGSFDTLTSDAIAFAPAYAGFIVTKTAATQVQLTPGRLYDATGAVWELSTPSTIDFFSLLPLVTLKWVALVVNGVDVQGNVQPRDFLINATTGQTQPQSVAMEDSRLAVVNTVAGVEAPQPSYPPTGLTVTVIAYVQLSTTGITQIVQYAPTQLPNLQQVEGQVGALQVWQAQAGAQINSLATGLTALKNYAKGLAAESELQAATNAIAQIGYTLNYINGRIDALAVAASHANPTVILTETFHSCSFFGWDYTNGSFTAIVQDGISFPGASTSTATLLLLNPLDVNAAINSNFLMPAYVSVARLTCSGYSAQLQVSQFSYLSGPTYTLLRRRRRRYRCGARYLPTVAADLAKSAPVDPIAFNLAFTGESFGALTAGAGALTANPAYPSATLGIWQPSRLTSYWLDDYTEPYWNRVTSTYTVTGQHIAQVFLNAQDGWITQLGVYFTQAALTGDVTVSLCSVNALGAPDLTQAIQTVTLPVASILTGSLSGGAGLPTLVETTVSFAPTYLIAGRRYAVVIGTPGAHYLAMTQTDWSVLQGSYFWADSTGLFNVDTTQQIRLNLYYAKWAATRYEIQLQPISLAGGISAIDFLAEAHVPGACSLEFHVQVAGVWYPLAADGFGPPLSGAPTLCPLKAVFIGTTDLMPGHGLAALSQALCFAGQAPSGALSCTALTTVRTPGSSSQNIRVDAILTGWNASYHTATIRIKSGATYYTATTVADFLLPDGSYRRTCYFAPGTPLASYFVQADCSTSLAGNVFKIARLSHTAC